ncbi:hypothetical protein DDE05_00705 [Streptomyces cavourensis]|nr:hypothetical protein DDE05_00705 [Streptomyces cavourensis]
MRCDRHHLVVKALQQTQVCGSRGFVWFRFPTFDAIRAFALQQDSQRLGIFICRQLRKQWMLPLFLSPIQGVIKPDSLADVQFGVSNKLLV